MNHRELISALTPLHGAGEARAIVRMVMEERFGLSQTDLLLGKDTTLSPNDRAEMEKIASRLIAGEPVQHVLGYAHFCGHRFRVTPDVLIPRPETEDLVRWAEEELAASSSPASSPIEILDLCTGSGCIATTLALAFPAAHVVGIDISTPALAVARDNAAALGATNVEFIEGDVIEAAQAPLPAPPSALCDAPLAKNPQLSTFNSQFSILLSNPPYVRHSEAADIHPSVLDHEPSLALFVPDAEPLIFYHSIALFGLRALRPGAPVLVELNAALAADTRTLFASYGYTDIQLRDDRYGRPRMLLARRQKNIF